MQTQLAQAFAYTIHWMPEGGGTMLDLWESKPQAELAGEKNWKSHVPCFNLRANIPKLDCLLPNIL